MKKSLQARADKLGTLGCKVALTHLSRKGRLSQIASASLSEALEACTPEQQLALQQELQKGPEQLLQLLRVGCMDAANVMRALQYCKQAELNCAPRDHECQQGTRVRGRQLLEAVSECIGHMNTRAEQ